MTTAKDPVFNGRELQDGATVVAAGSNLLQKREIDSMVIRRSSRIVVESVDQSQLEAGIYSIQSMPDSCTGIRFMS